MPNWLSSTIDDTNAPVAYPCLESTSASVTFSSPSLNVLLARAPWCTGYKPVMIEACDGNVVGDGATASEKSTPSLARRSSAGVVALS